MIPSPVQKGNPHKLTINQHIFPRSGLKRFAIDDHVQLRRVVNPTIIPARTDLNIFCANRAWDQRAETLFSHGVEKSFSNIADGLAAGTVTSLSSDMCEVLREFYVLCSDRYHFHTYREPDAEFQDMSGNKDLTLDQQEALEKKGVFFVRPDGKIHGRMIAGIHMMGRRLHLMRNAHYKTWGIWRAQAGEFVIPDNFTDMTCLPISPTIWLMANSDNSFLDYISVAQLNSMQITRARSYYFARNFDSCPVYKRTIPQSTYKRLQVQENDYRKIF